MGARNKSLNVLFADICDSTGLYASLGDDAGRRVVVECIELMKEVVQSFRGTVVETVGDELLSTFDESATAAKASRELHRAIVAANARFPTTVAIRVGFHRGPVGIDADQIFGDTVHVARRVVSLAKAQQTLTTGQAAEDITAADQLVTRFVDRTHLKGKAEAFDLFEILWDEGAATADARATSPESLSQRPASQMVLEFGGRSYQVDSMHPTLTIGRDARSDIVVEDAKVSRLHARIEYRRGRFVFVDQSTNGSQIIQRNGIQHFVRRDDYSLTREGTIMLGPADDESSFPTIVFRLHYDDQS